MSSIISLLPFDLYKLYSIAVEVYYALRAFALKPQHARLRKLDGRKYPHLRSSAFITHKMSQNGRAPRQCRRGSIVGRSYGTFRDAGDGEPDS